MAIPVNTCCSTIVFPDFGAGTHTLPIPGGVGWTLVFKVGSTVIMSTITFSSLDNPLSVSSIQAVIDANATYQASGYTITVLSLDSNGLTVSICKASTSQITDQSEGIFSIVVP